MTAPVRSTEHSRVVERRRWKPGGLGPGMILGGLAALAVLASLFMSWSGADLSEIPLEFLWDASPESATPSLLLVLVPFLLVLAIGALAPMGAGARGFGAIAISVTCAVFAFQVDQSLDAVPGADLGDALDTGFYVAFVGALVAFASALLPSTWGATDEVEVIQTEDSVR